tara:strand:- start:2646 stop:3617 length:972 start_codon:yes stop_codon:yes gene_type:complete
MASTLSIVYCTSADLYETYPQLSGFDLKKRVYGWKTTDTSNQYQAFDTGVIDQLYFDGIEGTAVADSPDADYEYNYSASTDSVQVFHTTKNPNDMVVEAGKDWETLQTATIKKASRMVESSLDSRLSREISKDREGSYPAYIVRATALKAICLLIKAHDPENPVLESFEEEFSDIIEGYRSGNLTLPNAITMDSSRGVIRTVVQGASSDLFPVELKGNYNGSGYELLKIKIESGHNGVIGTAKMTVYAKDTNQLKIDKVIDGETITGDFQSLGVSGLYIRWSGDDVASAICSTNDEYEVELHGSGMSSSVSQQGSIRMSRRYG